MIDIDLTMSDDEDDDIVVIKSKIVDCYQNGFDKNKPRSSQIDKDIYTFFYGTEDKSREFLSIQHPAARKVVRNSFTIYCSKCNQDFTNISFIDHAIDHFEIDLHNLDCLLLPKSYETNKSHQWCAIKCEICDIKFTSLITLGQHLERKHVHKDMPYVCFVCNFYRTSFLSELKQHFYDNHKNSQYLVCPICIETFELQPKNGNTDILDASVFLAHLDRHMTKRQFSCDRCSLKYFSKADLTFHKAIYHEGRDIPNVTDENNGNLSSSTYKAIVKKSLNVISQPIDVTKLNFNIPKLNLTCSECHENLTNLATHYQSYVICGQCAFSSYCAVSFRKHTRTMHGSAVTENGTMATIDICRHGVMLCECGYKSLHGDKVAQHLTKCIFSYCTVKPRNYTPLPQISEETVNCRDDLFLVPSSSNQPSTYAASDFFKMLHLQAMDCS